MSTAPAPFTPAECDLRGMPYMPLDVVRLFDSDFYALSNGDEFKAGLSLWGKAFLQVPAGSLPDDDRILAHLSGAGPKWCKVKEMALRGWIKCEDGRLYHATVAEKVAEAWQARVDRRARTEAARAAKIAAKHATNGSQPPPSATVSVTEPVAMSVTDNVTTLVAQSVTGSKGSTREGKGREEKKERAEGGGTMPPARSRARPPTPIPLDWQPSVELVEFGARLGMTEATVQRAADRMVDWAKGSGNRKVDWDATLRNWLRKDAEEPAFKSGALQLIREEGMPSVEVDNPVGTFLAGIPMARTEVQHIRDWLKALGSLAACALTAAEFSAKIAAYAPLLAADFSQAAFSPTSLAHVARQCKFFPTYAELCAILGAWWREHRPPPTVALLDDPKNRTNEQWREMAEQSWSAATAFDVRAKVAEIQRITVPAHCASLGRMLAHAVRAHAPAHLPLIPPQWQDNAP